MGKFLKVIMFTVLFATIIFTGTTFASNDVVVEDHLKSVQSYIKYLEDYDETEALRLGIAEPDVKEAVKQSKITLKEFSRLSTSEQKLFLKYMSNTHKLIEDTLKGVDSNLKLIINEDISYGTSIGTQSNNIRSIEHEGKMTLLGITWTKYMIEGKYEYNSSGATNKLVNRAWVSWNINPTVTNTKVSDEGYVSGGKYYGEGKWEYKIGAAGTGIGIQIGTVDIRVEGNHTGKTNGSFWKT